MPMESFKEGFHCESDFFLGLGLAAYPLFERSKCPKPFFLPLLA